MCVFKYVCLCVCLRLCVYGCHTLLDATVVIRADTTVAIEDTHITSSLVLVHSIPCFSMHGWLTFMMYFVTKTIPINDKPCHTGLEPPVFDLFRFISHEQLIIALGVHRHTDTSHADRQTHTHRHTLPS